MKFDIIGDIHGCYDELMDLLEKLGYRFDDGIHIHPDGRMPAFVGDAMDRGPDSLKVMELLFARQDRGILHYSPGNHCNKLYRFMKGNQVQLAHGLEITIADWQSMPKKEKQNFRERYIRFYEELPQYLVLCDDLIVAHAGLKQEMIGVPVNRKIAVFTLYGDITGKFHADGRPVRRDWAKSYQGGPWIVYGHTPTEEPYLINKTANIDTGCVFGGSLTAFRFPEKELVAVPSRQPYQPDRFHRFI
ncbi:bis(5'-nucleosyl)-tetraphosphatase PrpE [Planomicrobium okeanokoites]|uniref:bis(5'-nucleosyl)-tetraphosphatase PrpE n=1 Tax=Planomicrobium okeanokoites TaxID=244 RepID=UPI0009FEF96F|nr:bis(5'-nucleosyl)-tetraphosphatase PrpE [Planomicrobium okeanokoites]